MQLVTFFALGGTSAYFTGVVFGDDRKIDDSWAGGDENSSKSKVVYLLVRIAVGYWQGVSLISEIDPKHLGKK